jgi:hypothetical protein
MGVTLKFNFPDRINVCPDGVAWSRASQMPLMRVCGSMPSSSGLWYHSQSRPAVVVWISLPDWSVLGKADIMDEWSFLTLKPRGFLSEYSPSWMLRMMMAYWQKSRKVTTVSWPPGCVSLDTHCAARPSARSWSPIPGQGGRRLPHDQARVERGVVVLVLDGLGGGLSRGREPDPGRTGR